MSTTTRPRAVIADDERLLREQIQTRLGQVWPELEVVALAKDGEEAVRLVDEHRPDVVFLDIRMPGKTGIEAARDIVDLDGWQGEIVFVTAYDEYAIAAFEHGAVDYLLKPVERERLARTVERLQARMRAPGQAAAPAGAQPTAATADEHLDNMLKTLSSLQQTIDNQRGLPAKTLQWLQCTTGNTTHLVAVADVLFFRSDEKYTRVQTATSESFIRTPIKDLIAQLDPDVFWQIHRSAIVNLKAVASVTRDDTGRQRVSIKGHPEVLEVSRSFSHLFKGQ